MPIYSFLCNCGNTQIELKSMNDQNPVACNLCGKPMIRLFSKKTGFILKGTGWAADNYGDKKSVE